ncbi:MAG TPA: hypothetical protein VFQ61_36865, partial [Polyangiaceae bacterium]|nr:hypothetical protein [Polyangiaceae bacterium]
TTGFRPRQPTLPMGVAPATLVNRDLTGPEHTPTTTQVTPTAAAVEEAGVPTPAAHANAAAPSSRPSVPRGSVGNTTAVLATPPQPAELRATSTSAAAPTRDTRETVRLTKRKDTPPQAPRVMTVPELSDDEPTVLRPSPFAELRKTPRPMSPEDVVRELERQGMSDVLDRPPEKTASPAAGLVPEFLASPTAARPADVMSIPTPVAIPVHSVHSQAVHSQTASAHAAAPVPPPALPSTPFAVSAMDASHPVAVSSPLPAPMPAAGTASLRPDEIEALRTPKNRVMWIFLALMVLVAIAFAALTLTRTENTPKSGGKGTDPAAAENAAAEATPAGVAPAGSESPTGSDGANSPNAASAANGADSAAAPSGAAPSSSGGFAKLFAAGAKQAAGPSDQLQPFDANAARVALDGLMLSAARCREPGGPLGVARVVVTFAPSGNVTSATITDAPFAGTNVGTCLCDVMKRATITPFEGPPGNVTQRVSLR